MIAAVLTHLLAMGQIEFALQNGANPEDPVSSVTRISLSGDEILAAAGSRYAPSSPVAGLEAYLGAGRRFAFVGKPCDAATLHRMALHNTRIDRLIPVKLSFFCAGGSRKGALEVVKAFGVLQEYLVEFSYRCRDWPGLTPAVCRDGSEESMDYNSSWKKILNRHLQFAVKFSQTARANSSIFCADAWHGKDGDPDFTEREGRSLIIARSQIG